MGVVHHSEYIRYFEEARNTWLHALGYSHQDSMDDNVVFPVVNLNVSYKHSVHYGESVKVTASVVSFDCVTLQVHHQVLDMNGTVCADGDVTIAFLSTKLGHPVRCPEKLKKLIDKHLNS